MGSEQDRLYLNHLRENSNSTMGRLTAYFETRIKAGRVNTSGTAQELAMALMGMEFNFAVFGPLYYDIELKDLDKTSEMIVNIFLNSL